MAGWRMMGNARRGGVFTRAETPNAESRRAAVAVRHRPNVFEFKLGLQVRNVVNQLIVVNGAVFLPRDEASVRTSKMPRLLSC